METKKQQLKQSFKEILAVVLCWLFALSILYIVFLKIKMLIH
jgi:hypothetical protein